MRTAFPYWQSRLAPVFDTARQILAREDVAYVHIRSKFNCFQCRVDH